LEKQIETNSGDIDSILPELVTRYQIKESFISDIVIELIDKVKDWIDKSKDHPRVPSSAIRNCFIAKWIICILKVNVYLLNERCKLCNVDHVEKYIDHVPIKAQVFPLVLGQIQHRVGGIKV